MVAVPVTFAAEDTRTGLSASTTATLSALVPFGLNLTSYATVAPSLPGVSFVKVFADPSPGTSGVPAKWPGNPANPVPAGVTAMVVILPDPAMTLAGQLDGPLSDYFALAPAGSMVTAWGEGNRETNPYWSQAGASASQWADLHACLHSLAAAANPQIAYGACYSTYPVHAQNQDIAPWVAPGLGFQAMDGYDSQGNSTPEAIFGQAWDGILSADPGARPAVAETNSADTTGEWFSAVWDWLVANRGTLLATFWGKGGEGSQHEYDFSATAGYVSALQSIASTCAA